MSGIMMNVLNNLPQYPNNNVWTGTTTGLQLNLLNAPNSGTTWRDATGNGNVGTIRKLGTGTATYVSANNGGLSLGPSQATNEAMVSTNYNLSGSFTVEVVANITATSFWSTLWGNENYNASTGYWAYWNGSTVLQIGSIARTNLYSVTANAGVIRQFTVVFDTSPSATLYINGVLQSPISSSYGLAPSSTTNGLNFGSRHPNDGTSNVPNDSAIGTYYQMRAYNIALNQSQVTANYNAIKTTYGI